MAATNITGIVKHQIRTTSSWTSVNPVLLLGEIGIDSDLNIIKVGDGSSTWSALDHMGYCGVDDSSSYRGLRDKANGTSDWIRTTVNGIIPHAVGVNSSLGTSSWGFSSIYGENPCICCLFYL